MNQVRAMIAAGVRVSIAIREALIQQGFDHIEHFANEHALDARRVRKQITGAERPMDGTLAALSEVLGGTPDEWAEFLWLAGKPVPSRRARIAVGRYATPTPTTIEDAVQRMPIPAVPSRTVSTTLGASGIRF